MLGLLIALNPIRLLNKLRKVFNNEKKKEVGKEGIILNLWDWENHVLPQIDRKSKKNPLIFWPSKNLFCAQNEKQIFLVVKYSASEPHCQKFHFRHFQ